VPQLLLSLTKIARSLGLIRTGLSAKIAELERMFSHTSPCLMAALLTCLSATGCAGKREAVA